MLICLGERGSLLVRHTNTVTCSAVYIWSHSGPAYWKLFICGDTGEADPPHMFSLTCRCQHVTYFSEVFCFDVSFICISLILSSPRLFLRPRISTSPRPLGAVGPIQGPWFGSVPDPAACADRPSANLLLISCRDEAIAFFFSFFLSAHLIGPMTHYLHTLNFSAAVISCAHLDKHQL